MKYKHISSATGENITYYHSFSENTISGNFLPHYHERCELILFLQGDVSYVVEGRTYKLKKGDIVISMPRQIHMILPKEDTTYERYVSIINQKLIPEGIWKKLCNGQDIFPCRDNERIFDLFEKLDFYYEKFSEEEYARLVFNTIEEVMYNLTLPGSEEVGASINPIVSAALDYIRDNLTTVSGVDEICSALYITKSHLHHLFTEHLQITPARYIATKRLILAQRKIRKGGKPTEIYSDCGFSDYATFFRNYKRHFGYSPTLEGKVKVSEEILS